MRVKAITFFGLPIGGMLVLAMLSAAGLMSDRFGYLLLALSVFSFGMPHGAMDFEVSRRMKWWSDLGGLAKFCAGYLLCVGLVLAFCFVLPVWALGLFLLLTAWHWGTAESYFSSQSRRSWAGVGLARGMVIMLAPICFHPVETSAILDGFVGWFGLSHIELSNALPLLLTILFAAVIVDVGYALAQWKSKAGSIYLWFAVEALLLPFFFALTPPVTAVAFYFVGVHAYRHMLRMCVGQEPLSEMLVLMKRFIRQHVRLWWAALLPMAPVVIILSRQAVITPPEATGIYLVLLFCLTVPHAFIVSRLDQSEMAHH